MSAVAVERARLRAEARATFQREQAERAWASKQRQRVGCWNIGHRYSDAELAWIDRQAPAPIKAQRYLKRDLTPSLFAGLSAEGQWAFNANKSTRGMGR